VKAQIDEKNDFRQNSSAELRKNITFAKVFAILHFFVVFKSWIAYFFDKNLKQQ